MAYQMFMLQMFVALVLVALVSAQGTQDVLTGVCFRYGHQTAVIDRKLYIDGGLLVWGSTPPPSGRTPDTNTKLIYGDLDNVNDGMPVLHSNVTKNSDAPSVAGGILWADQVNKVFWLYGGETQTAARNSFDLWGYDTILNQWNRSDAASKASSDIGRVSYGAGATLDRFGYYYGGYLNSYNTPGWSGPPLATSNLIIFDMNSSTIINSTGPAGAIGRAEGVMVAIPASQSGMLIYFGGVQFPYGNTTEVPMDMSKIIIYEKGDNKWYTQTATGNIPASRRKFCAGVTWDEKQSEYNVYLYGGFGFGANASGFDDVYILTMPTFQWVKWYPDQPGEAYPKGLTTCNVVAKGQMLVIGGQYSNTTASGCDVPSIGGQHNMALGQLNVNAAKWYQYLPNLTDYSVPKDVVAVAGNNKAPAAGWDNPNLGVYFGQKAIFSALSPTRYIPTATATTKPTGTGTPAPKSNIGAIAGGAAAGGVVLIVAAILIWWFCIKKRRDQKRKSDQVTHGTPQTQTVPPELNGGPERYSKTSATLVHTPNPQHQHPGSPNVPPYQASYSASSSPPPQHAMYQQQAMPGSQQYFPPQMQQQGYGPQPPYQYQQPQYSHMSGPMPPVGLYSQQQQQPQPFYPPPPAEGQRLSPAHEMPARGMTPGTYHVQQSPFNMQQPAPQRMNNYGIESVSGQSGDHQRLDSRSQSTHSPTNSTWKG